MANKKRLIVYRLDYRKIRNAAERLGFFCLLKQTARQLPQLKDDNTRTIFMHYALHTYGYDIKMGIIDKEVALLVPIQEKVYAYSYLPENGKKYYLFTAGEKPSATPVRTLPSLSRNKQRPFSLAITEPMLLAEDYRDTNRTYRDCSLNSPVSKIGSPFSTICPTRTWRSMPICRSMSLSPKIPAKDWEAG